MTKQQVIRKYISQGKLSVGVLNLVNSMVESDLTDAESIKQFFSKNGISVDSSTCENIVNDYHKSNTARGNFLNNATDAIENVTEKASTLKENITSKMNETAAKAKDGLEKFVNSDGVGKVLESNTTKAIASGLGIAASTATLLNVGNGLIDNITNKTNDFVNSNTDAFIGNFDLNKLRISNDTSKTKTHDSISDNTTSQNIIYGENIYDEKYDDDFYTYLVDNKNRRVVFTRFEDERIFGKKDVLGSTYYYIGTSKIGDLYMLREISNDLPMFLYKESETEGLLVNYDEYYM